MRKFEVVKDECRKTTGEITLPTRSDKGSAGYDFYAPYDFTINPGETVFVTTDVKAAMEEDEVLYLYVRSSVGIKKRILLANGTGVIDSTYYSNPDNDGNIIAALTNMSNQTWEFKKGERFVQGVFQKYLTVDNDAPLNAQRTGGIGSSGK